MDRRGEKEPSIFISEDMVDNGYDDEQRDEFILFEKGEKVSDLGGYDNSFVWRSDFLSGFNSTP